MDNMLIIDEVKEGSKVEVTSEAKVNPGDPWKPLLLFIPLRLGLSEINPVYFGDLKVWMVAI